MPPMPPPTQSDPLVTRWRACTTPRAPTFTISRGSRADLLALAPFHYASSHTGPLVLILSARDSSTNELGAVLAITMPALNTTWRKHAWPDLYEPPDLSAPSNPRECARRLNASVRTIARVIVDPRSRAMNLGSSLVRAYLNSPLTPRTETLTSSMRAFTHHQSEGESPDESTGGLFTRAGMRRVNAPRAARDWPMLDTLDSLSASPITLLDPATRDTLFASPRFRRALSRWLNASRATRPLINHPPEAASRVLIRALLAPPVPFIHDETHASHPRPQSLTPPLTTRPSRTRIQLPLQPNPEALP